MDKEILILQSRLTTNPLLSSTALTEKQHQVRVVKWAHAQSLPLIHINNEGSRSAKNGAILKAMGICRGFPDLALFEAYGGFMALFLEMKRDRVYSDAERNTVHWLEQEEWLTYLKNKGYYAEFAFGYKDAIQQLENYLKLPRTFTRQQGIK